MYIQVFTPSRLAIKTSPVTEAPEQLPYPAILQLCARAGSCGMEMEPEEDKGD